ncbi:MAG: hypothetical protein K2M41_02320 [Muribaculaceae bacterium]|nr:hypothetical protein [Muribaculaceae bacterium]
MKTTLTPEESQRLIDLGVDPKMASTTCINFNGTYAYVSGEESETVRDCVNDQYYTEECRCFSIADILSILPKEIEDSNLDIISTQVDIKNHKKVSGWMVTYTDNYNDLAFGDESVFQSSELIDALNKLAIWCLENGHFKTERYECKT